MTIFNAILEKLKQAETCNNIKIPLAVESGSRSWGFASPDSDYDCRFIYVHEKDWYVSLLAKEDFIECEINEVFDVNGWDLKKALQHVVKSNAVMFEWFLSDEVYISHDAIKEELLSLMDVFFNPVAVSYHYLNTAKNHLLEVNGTEQAKLKKYFYILRSLANLRYIHQYAKMPPTEYRKALEAITVPPGILGEIERLQEVKETALESYLLPKQMLLLNYFAAEMDFFATHIKTMRFAREKTWEDADAAFRKIIEMTWDNA